MCIRDRLPERDKEPVRMLQQMIQSYFLQAQQPLEYNYIYLQSILCRIIFYLYQHFQEKQSKEYRFNHKSFERITEIDNFIKQHYTEDISQEEIAGHVGLSTAYLDVYKRQAESRYF